MFDHLTYFTHICAFRKNLKNMLLYKLFYTEQQVNLAFFTWVYNTGCVYLFVNMSLFVKRDSWIQPQFNV